MVRNGVLQRFRGRAARASKQTGQRSPGAPYRRVSFESLEPRMLLATLDYLGGGTLAIYVNTGDEVLLGGASLDGNAAAPLSIEATTGSLALSGSADDYFNLVGSKATLAAGVELTVTNLAVQDQDDAGSVEFTFGDGTNTLPTFSGAALVVDQGFTAVTIQSSINTGTTGTQVHNSPTIIGGTVSLAAQDVTFGLSAATLNGSGGNDRLTITASSTVTLAGTIGQTTPLDYLSISSGSGDIALSATQIDGTESELRLASAGTITQTGGFSGSMEFTLVSGAATLNQANSYTGNTSVLEGTLTLNRAEGAAIASTKVTIGDGTGESTSAMVKLLAADQLADTCNVTTFGDGTFDLNGFNQTIDGLTMTGGQVTTCAGILTLAGDLTTNASAAQATLSGNLDLDAGTRIFTVAAGDADSDLFVSAVISNGSLTKAGAGTLELNGANLLTGDIVITAGTLLASNDAALGTTTGITTVMGGATLALSGVTIGEELEIRSTAGLRATGSTASVIDGDIELTVDADFLSAGPTLTINGVISGGTDGEGYSLGLSGGTFVLAGANTYRGGTAVALGAIVEVSSDANLGAVPTAFDADNLLLNVATLRATASFVLHAHRGLTVDAWGGAIDVVDGETLSYGGIVTGTLTQPLYKQGLGTLILGGESTLTGVIRAQAGTLRIDGSVDTKWKRVET
jgi:autotransporter-associated beta strand protein